MFNMKRKGKEKKMFCIQIFFSNFATCFKSVK